MSSTDKPVLLGVLMAASEGRPIELIELAADEPQSLPPPINTSDAPLIWGLGAFLFLVIASLVIAHIWTGKDAGLPQSAQQGPTTDQTPSPQPPVTQEYSPPLTGLQPLSPQEAPPSYTPPPAQQLGGELLINGATRGYTLQSFLPRRGVTCGSGFLRRGATKFSTEQIGFRTRILSTKLIGSAERNIDHCEVYGNVVGHPENFSFIASILHNPDGTTLVASTPIKQEP